MENVGERRKREGEDRARVRSEGEVAKRSTAGEGNGALAACRVRCVTPARSPLYCIVWVRWCHLPEISGVTCVSHPLTALSSPLPPTLALNEFRSSSPRERGRERRSNLNQPNLTRTLTSPLRARARDNALWVPRTSLTRDLSPHYHHHHDRFDECPLRLTWGINRGGVG